MRYVTVMPSVAMAISGLEAKVKLTFVWFLNKMVRPDVVSAMQADAAAKRNVKSNGFLIHLRIKLLWHKFTDINH